MLTRRLHNFPTCCHVQWMTVVHWAVNLSATEYSETTAYQTTSNCGGPFFCPRDLCPKQDPIMGPRACSILRMEGRRFAYGILRENTDRCGLWIFCFCSGEYCCECPRQFAHPSRAGSSRICERPTSFPHLSPARSARVGLGRAGSSRVELDLRMP